MWFVDKLGPAPKDGARANGAPPQARQAPAPAVAPRAQAAQTTAAPPRTAAPPPPPEPDPKKKKKGWF